MNDYDLTIDDLTLTKDSESCRLTAYPDPGTGGAPWTIGWGHTGPEVHPGLVWTQAQADAQLVKDMQSAEAAVRKYVTHEITRDQFIALCDFVFNIGSSAFNTSTLLRKLNAYDLEGAIEEFAKWNKAGGRVLNGLIKRRDGEKALFILGTSYG
jgi:lysozyme